MAMLATTESRMTNINPQTTAAVDAAITSRRSVRAFLPRPVPRQTIEDILAVAARAPSGVNTQPWKVTVLTGQAKTALTQKILAAHDANAAAGSTGADVGEYDYYPTEWAPPYIDRRRKIGWDLYGLLGIGKGDKPRMHAQHGRNYSFFDAPVGLIFTIDRVLRQGSWLDYGMFLQNVMTAARGRGLERDGGVRHVARLCRRVGAGEPARHRARAGERLHALRRMT
jgi:nitroreductase